MAIYLKKEPLFLCHYDRSAIDNHFAYGIPIPSIQIGNDTSKSKFGDASLKLNPVISTDPNYNIKVTLNDKFDFTSDFTISFYKYVNAMVSNINGNGNSSTFWFSYATLFIDSGGSYSFELTKGNPNPSRWIDTRNLYSANTDVGKWVHIEFSYNAASKTVRVFRNGTAVLTRVLDSDLDYYSPMPMTLIIQDDANISEILITKDCLHTANFEPPTEPYSWYNIKDAYRDIPTNKLHGYK